MIAKAAELLPETSLLVNSNVIQHMLLSWQVVVMEMSISYLQMPWEAMYLLLGRSTKKVRCSQILVLFKSTQLVYQFTARINLN